MSKKIIAVAAAVIILAAFGVVGGTLAWFTDSEASQNVFTTGKVAASLTVTPGSTATKGNNGGYQFSSLMPGDTLYEKVSFGLEQGSSSAFVRMKFTVNVDQGDKVIDNKGTKVSDLIAGHIASAVGKDWQKGNDGWYYLNRALEFKSANSFYADFIPDVLKFDGNKFDNNCMGIRFSIDFKAQAIQTANQSITEPFHAEKLSKLSWPEN